MLPKLASKLIGRWLAITMAVSIIAIVDGGFTWSWLALSPDRVWAGEIWRLVTLIFAEPSAISLVFVLAAIFKFGGELAYRWGDRRLRRYLIEVLGASAVVTTVLGLASDEVRQLYTSGGRAVADVLVIAWARQFPTAELSLYYSIQLSGRALVWLTVGITTLLALGDGILPWAPELVACAAAVLYPHTRLRA